MTGGTFDFYNSSSIKFYNLDQNIRYQLAVLEILDPITKKHCMNVGNLCGRLCQYLNLNSEFTVYCITSGYLHDIGKSKVPYEILSKPTRLTDEEFEIIKKHTTYGYEMCIKDAHLRPFADGVLYHHEALNGTGYPQKLTAEKIPIVARIIRVADEYDALTTKRHYTTHVNISKTLQDMIEDTKPAHEDKTVALGVLSENSQNGKISPYILKALFKAVIEDTEYEISMVEDYLKYLKDNIKRLELIDSYNAKMQTASTQKKRDYYKEGIEYLFTAQEDYQNYHDILSEYRTALEKNSTRISDLHKEIRIIKSLKV